jgi:hypothetical protein
VGEAARDGYFVNGFFHRVADKIHVHRCGSVLADSMDARDGLQLDGGVDQRLAQEDVRGIHEIETRRVGLGVEEEALDGWVVAELLDASSGADAREADLEAFQRVSKHVQEVAELAEDNGLRARVCLSYPKKMSAVISALMINQLVKGRSHLAIVSTFVPYDQLRSIDLISSMTLWLISVYIDECAGSGDSVPDPDSSDSDCA